MRRSTFYICKHCGNIAMKPVDSGVPLVCCGEEMAVLEANSTDAATEKHVPAVTVTGNEVHVEVGSTQHPMEEDHYIEWVYLGHREGRPVQVLQAGRGAGGRFRAGGRPSDRRVRILQQARSVGGRDLGAPARRVLRVRPASTGRTFLCGEGEERAAEAAGCSPLPAAARGLPSNRVDSHPASSRTPRRARVACVPESRTHPASLGSPLVNFR